MDSKRIIYFDYLRIIAIFAVVIAHVAAQSWYLVDVRSHEWNVLNFFDGGFRWGPPVFVMISGALFLEKRRPLKEIYSKNILRIIIAFVFWSVFYALWGFFVTGKVDTFEQLISEAIIGHYHLWFLPMIVGLYMMVPFFEKIVEDKKLALYFVGLSVIFAFLLPRGIRLTEFKWPWLSKAMNNLNDAADIHFVLGYSVYFILGYLLSTGNLSRKTTGLIYLGGALGSLITIGMTAIASKLQQSHIIFFYGNFNVNMLMTSVAVFTFARQHMNVEKSSGKKRHRLTYISKCCFGVYLIHPFLIEEIEALFGINALSFDPVLSVPVLAGLVFTLSLLLSCVLNTIPAVRNWIV